MIDFDSVKKIKLEPDEFLVLKTERHINVNQMAFIKDQLGQAFGANVIVLAGGFGLEVVKEVNNWRQSNE